MQDRAAKLQQLLGNMLMAIVARIRTNVLMVTIQQDRQVVAPAWPFMDGATVIGMLAGVMRPDATTVAPVITLTTIAFTSVAGTDALINLFFASLSDGPHSILTHLKCQASWQKNNSIFISHFVPLSLFTGVRSVKMILNTHGAFNRNSIKKKKHTREMHRDKSNV